MPARRALLLLFAILAVAALGALLDRASKPSRVPTVPVPTVAGGTHVKPFEDPFAWAPDRAAEFSRRAARGFSQILYARSPGGVEATAARVARYRPLIERAAARAGVSADRLEGLVFLESAGRADAVTPVGLEGAVGLTQILAETAQNLLGMHVDLAASRRLTRRIERALSHGHERKARRLEARRRRADQRFDPARSLDGTARYLAMARERFDREDLAFVSYHMGMGNLEDVLASYGSRDVPWVEVFFASTPFRHRATYERLRTFGDESAAYYWKIEAARQIMRLWRDDRPRLARTAALYLAKASAEERLHPSATTARFSTEADLRAAWARGDLRAFPASLTAFGLRRSKQMGELAPKLHAPVALYRGLRPAALALAVYIGTNVRALDGRHGTLTVTSTLRDQPYQDLLIRRNDEATQAYSLHTTGWTFDVLREYDSRRQALAFQWMLDRLEALDVIAWVREPAAIHITVGSDAEKLLPLLDRVAAVRRGA